MSTTSERIKLALFLRNFQLGGTERQVFELAKHVDKGKYDVYVIVLRAVGALRESVESLQGVRTVALDAANSAATLLRLTNVVRRYRIDVLHSFSSATNAYSLATKMFVPRIRIVVGLRNALEDSCFGYASQAQRAKIRALDLCLKWFGSRADLFISNSEAGRAICKRHFGFEAKVIPNGIDIGKFRPDDRARAVLGQAIGAPPDAYVIGIVANFSAYKDYPTFIRAARIVANNIPNVQFVAIGDDRTAVGTDSKELVKALSLQSIFHFCGPCHEAQTVIPGFDVLCSSSSTEGFSNSIAEAMACGIPCVVTDVGDSREIVGDTGVVAQARDPEALAAGLVHVLSLPAPELYRLRSAARERIVQNYGISQTTAQHERAYESLTLSKSPLPTLDSADPTCDAADEAIEVPDTPVQLGELAPQCDRPASSHSFKVLAVIPGDGLGATFIFARRQVESLRSLGLQVDVHFFSARLWLQGVIQNCWQIRNLVRKLHPDVIHVHYGTMTAFATAVVTRQPLVITFRGSDLQPEPGVGELRVWIGTLLSQLATLRASRVICVSDRLKSRLWWRKHRATVLPTGVNLDQFQPGNKAEARKALGWDIGQPAVLFNAGKAPLTKGLDIAEAAVAEAVAAYGPIRLEVMRGNVPPENVPVLMNASDCLLVTSRTEASPGIVKEALACNLSIVSVDVGDVAERLKGVTLSRIVKRDPAHIAKALIDVLSNKRRSNGRERIAELSEERIAEHLRSIYRSICHPARQWQPAIPEDATER